MIRYPEILVLLALFCFACTEKEPGAVNEPQPGPMEFKACANVVSKTTMDGRTVKWSTGDKLSVFDGSGNREFSLQSLNPDGSAVFSGEAITGKPKYFATYPFDAANYLADDGSYVRTGFYSAQTATSPGTFDDGFNPSVACSENGVLSFQNLGGLLHFKLLGENVTCVTLTAKDSGTVGGVYFVHFDSAGNIASIDLASPRAQMTLKPSGRSTFQSGDYYFCLSARTFTGGITMALNTSDGEMITVGTTSDVVVARSKITSVGEIDSSPDKQKRNLNFTSIDLLNQAGSLNSHASVTGTSVLTPIAGTEVTVSQDIATGGPQPQYPRLAKTSSGSYILFYHPSGNGVSASGNKSCVLRSDNLTDWSYAGNPFPNYSFTDCAGEANTRGYAGAHPLLLPNGDLLAVASTRAIKNYRDRNADNGLAIRKSSDGGQTWSSEQIVYVGTNWEPMPVLLPSGRIQIYYPDSKKMDSDAFGAGNVVVSTGTSYIYSDDGGQTWTPSGTNDHLRAFAQVRYTSGSDIILTDQMPAVITLNNTNTLAAAAESFIGGASYTSYISLAYTDASGSWGTPNAQGVLPTDRSNNIFTGSAPYLVQFPSGETVLSYNRNDYFYYRNGNAQARNFGAEHRFFSGGADGFWGSMCLIDSHRLFAGIGGLNNCLRIGQFYLNHAITASSKTITVDSRTMDWAVSDEALWLCSGTASKATLRCAEGADYLYFLVEVEDANLSTSDYVDIYLAKDAGTLNTAAIRIRANAEGLLGTARYSSGWVSSSDAVVVRSAYDGSLGSGDTDHGYLVEIAVPLSSLPVFTDRLLLNFAMNDSDNGGAVSIVPLSSSAADWLPILGLASSSGIGGTTEAYNDYTYTYELN